MTLWLDPGVVDVNSMFCNSPFRAEYGVLFYFYSVVVHRCLFVCFIALLQY